MSTSVRFAFLSFALALVLASQPSRAADEPARDPAAAEVLFRQGRKFMEAREYAAACPKFAESQRLDPAVGTLMNWATCEENLGRLASAWQRWREALDALPPDDDRVALAKERVMKLEKRLPRLTVMWNGPGVSEATVVRDGVQLGLQSLGVALPVDPGRHTVVVRMADHVDQHFSIAVAESESKLLSVSPGPVVPRPAAAQKRSSGRTLGYVLGGVGVAGVGAAVATGLMIDSARSTVDAHCDGRACRDQAGLDAAARGRTLLPINAAAWVVGAAGLGVGAYLVFFRGQGTTSTVGIGTDPTVAGPALRAWGTF